MTCDNCGKPHLWGTQHSWWNPMSGDGKMSPCSVRAKFCIKCEEYDFSDTPVVLYDGTTPLCGSCRSLAAAAAAGAGL